MVKSKFGSHWNVHTVLHSHSSATLSEQAQEQAALFREPNYVNCQDCHGFYMSF